MTVLKESTNDRIAEIQLLRRLLVLIDEEMTHVVEDSSLFQMSLVAGKAAGVSNNERKLLSSRTKFPNVSPLL